MQIQEYLEKTIKHLGVEEEFEIEIQETEDRLKISITVPVSDAALLIGNRGETLEALELLTKLSFKDEYQNKRIMLDINEYRASVERKLQDRALEIAHHVLETGRTQEMSGLNSYERYLVHSTIMENAELNEEIESVSEDRDDNRVLLIRLKK